MGGISSVISGIDNVASVVGTVSSLANNIDTLSGQAGRQQEKTLAAQQNLALSQLKAQQASDLKTQQAAAGLQKQELAAQQEETDDEQGLALRKAVASQRASFAARGISSGDGSGQAVLLGLTDEADDENNDRDQIATLKSAAIGQGLANAQSADILQLTQLQQRQNLDRQLLKKKDSIF